MIAAEAPGLFVPPAGFTAAVRPTLLA